MPARRNRSGGGRGPYLPARARAMQKEDIGWQQAEACPPPALAPTALTLERCSTESHPLSRCRMMNGSLGAAGCSHSSPSPLISLPASSSNQSTAKPSFLTLPVASRMGALTHRYDFNFEAKS